MTHVSLINAVMFNNLAQDDFDLNQQYFMSLEQEETLKENSNRAQSNT